MADQSDIREMQMVMAQMVTAMASLGLMVIALESKDDEMFRREANDFTENLRELRDEMKRMVGDQS